MLTSNRPLDHLSDATLLGRVARQDVAAFDAFYDRHVAAAYAAAHRLVGTRQRTDDVCQEAFLSIWRSADRFDAARGSAAAWVSVVVRNRAIDQLRSAKRTRDRELLDDLRSERLVAPSATGTESVALQNAQATEVRALLDVLDDDQRQVIELAFYGDCTHVEIAARLGLPLGTVKARIKRGLARMAHGRGPAAADRRAGLMPR